MKAVTKLTEFRRTAFQISVIRVNRRLSLKLQHRIELQTRGGTIQRARRCGGKWTKQPIRPLGDNACDRERHARISGVGKL